MTENINFFSMAQPVWLKDRENEINCCMGLLLQGVNLSEAILNITGATFYQVYLNNKLIHYGPARKAKGIFAVDTVVLPQKCSVSELFIRVIGYNCECFNGVTNPSFVCAEIKKGEQVIASTGKNSFQYFDISSHLKKVSRYSPQRQYIECWDFHKDMVKTDISVVKQSGIFAKRNIPYFDYEYKSALCEKQGFWEKTEKNRIQLFNYLNGEVKLNKSFEENEYQSNPYKEYLKINCIYNEDCVANENNTVGLWNFKKIEAGFFKLKITAETDCKVILAFSEQLSSDGRINMSSLNSVNVIELCFPRGEHTFHSLEPYTAMYAEVIIVEGKATVKSLDIIELAFPKTLIKTFAAKDDELDLIYNAAVETFRHNVVDIYMDCPSRERAGWLFDSYYMAKTEWELTGKTTVENEFLNNYRLGGTRDDLDGMVSMCYPADTQTDTFIPQWSMWYVLELYEYFIERGNDEKKNMYKEQLLGLIRYFEKYENEFGLLEKLEGWNFVEWSALNDRIFDVNWATNMLYCDFMKKIGNMYDINILLEKSERLKNNILKMAFNGEMFYDRAVRDENGELKNLEEFSETTQYYALKFNIIDFYGEKYSTIRHMFFDVFGTDKMSNYPYIEKANLMPGIYMRIELLLKLREYEMLKMEIKKYFLNMAKESGTLWEHYLGNCSRDHGFASYIGCVLKQLDNM